jgi:hypothetical protein
VDLVCSNQKLGASILTLALSKTGYKIKSQNQAIHGNKSGDQTGFLTYIGPPRVSPPVLDLPLLHLRCWLTFFMESSLCQNKILQILWTDPSLLEHTQFCSLHEYTQIRDEIGFRAVLGGHQPLLNNYLICLKSTSFNSRFLKFLRSKQLAQFWFFQIWNWRFLIGPIMS